MLRLSIITINRNDAKGLEHTLTSVWKKQTFEDFEHLIIDGASDDGSVDIIRKYESKLAYWVSEPDKGVYNAMNKGVIKARGEYLLFLNSGDWLEDDILRQVFEGEILEDILYANLYYNYDMENIAVESYPEKLTVPYLLTSSLGHPSTFIRRTLFDKSLYEEKYRIISDWVFFVKKIMLEGCTTRHLNLVTTHFNTYGMSSAPENFDLILREKKDFFDNGFPHLISDFFQEYSIRDKTLNILSKNRVQRLICSTWVQKRVRQYMKILFVLERCFKRSSW